MKNEILIEQFSYYTFISAKEIKTKDYLLTKHDFVETKMLYVKEIVSFEIFFKDLKKFDTKYVVFDATFFPSHTKALSVESELKKNGYIFFILRG